VICAQAQTLCTCTDGVAMACAGVAMACACAPSHRDALASRWLPRAFHTVPSVGMSTMTAS